MAEAIVISTLANCAVTELIGEVRTCLKAAKRCKSECRKLEKELKVIAPDVEKIEKRLAFLQGKCNGHHYEDLKMVEDWLERLKDAIQLANIAVRQCNSGNRLFKCKLSERITSAYENITKAADNRVGYFLQLNNLTIPEEPRPVPCYKSPGKADLLRMTQEKNKSFRREDLNRLSMSSSGSHNICNGRYGSPIFSQDSSYHSPGSSSFYGKESSMYETSESPHWRLMSQQRNVWMTQERNESSRRGDLTRHSMSSSNSHSAWAFYGKESSVHESSESPHLRLMSQQRNEIPQREDPTRSPLGHSHQMERLYTLNSSIVPQHQHYVPTNNSSSIPYYMHHGIHHSYTQDYRAVFHYGGWQ